MTNDQQVALLGLHSEASTSTLPQAPSSIRFKSDGSAGAAYLSNHDRPVDNENNTPTRVWDGWPNGSFSRHFTPQEVLDTNRLETNWVTETFSSLGSPHATTWEKGKIMRRRCLGTLTCSNASCHVTVAPALRGLDPYQQLQAACPFGRLHL